MYAASQDFIDATAAESRSVKVKAIFNSDPLTEITGESADGSVISLVYDEVMDDTQGITIGSAGMSQLELTFYMPSTPIALRNGTVQPYIGLVLEDDSVEYVPLGFFWITEISTTDDYKSVTVTAYDNMSLLSETYDTTLGWDTTYYRLVADIYGDSAEYDSNITYYSDSAGTVEEDPEGNWDPSALYVAVVGAEATDVLQDIANQYNLTYTAPAWLSSVPVLSEYIEGTCRDYVGWIAGLAGMNAKFDRSGELVFAWYETDTTAQTISRDIQYLGGVNQLADGVVTISSITSGTDTEPVTAGNGYGITAYNPYMTQGMIEDVYAAIGGISYYPMECKWRGNPALETGDVAYIAIASGEAVAVPVATQKLSVTGGLTGEIYCYGYTEEGYIISESPTQKEIRKTYTNLVQAIADASALINGAKGGIFVVTDSDGDGVNDGWLIANSPDVSAATQLIRASSGGIGICDNNFDGNGDPIYSTAMTAEGINADAITTGTMSAERVYVTTDAIDSGTALSDYFSVSLDGDGHPVVQIGSSANAIILKEQNDRISFYDTDGNELAYFSNNSFEIVDLEYFRLGKLAMTVQSNGSISFVEADDT